MLKQRELHETTELYELLKHPSVFPFVRHKATSAEEYLFMTKKLMEEEQNGMTISRTIVDEWGTPIGTISIFDIQEGAGFLGTWIGQPFQGFGYNQKAKLAFLHELFFNYNFHTVFLRIREENGRSQAAALKLPYIVDAADSNPSLFEEINQGASKFRLFKIPKDLFYLTTAYIANDDEEQAM